MAAEAAAPAKINLTLNVTGRRADGYHLLDSLVVFVDAADRVAAEPATDWSLEVTGPFAAGLAGPGNLVLRAAQMTDGPPARITLDKRLPVAAGMGGGSSDAAATWRVLAAMDGRPLPANTERLGADVPVCVDPRPRRMRGVGEELSDVPALPPLHLCLANPARPLSTPAVFAALEARENAPMGEIPAVRDAAALAGWLAAQRNDLEAPARSVEPAVGVTLSRLAATAGCLLTRMSGSGATCFGLYATRTEAEAATREIAARHPDWWVRAASTL